MMRPLRSKYALKHARRGILVEPQPGVFGRMQTTYAAAAARHLFENAAIGQGRSKLKMYPASKSANIDGSYAGTVVSASRPTRTSLPGSCESRKANSRRSLYRV